MREADSGWLRLSTVEFFLLWSAMDLGEPPVVLGVPRVGRTPRSRAAMAEEASRALAGRDLGTVREPARDLAAVLRLAAEHTTALEIRVYGTESPLFGFAAVGSRGAVAVARRADRILAGRIGREAMASTLLDSLQPMPPGPGLPANVRVADFDAACAEGEREGVTGFMRVLRSTGMRLPEANTLTRALTGRRGGGQVGASRRRPGGQPVRSPMTVSWMDTPAGRYAVRRSGEWITVTPVTPARLVAMAEETVTPLP
jgi:hypothetical protein